MCPHGCAGRALQHEAAGQQRDISEADGQLIFPSRQLGLMEYTPAGCEGGVRHKERTCIFPTVEVDSRLCQQVQ